MADSQLKTWQELRDNIALYDKTFEKWETRGKEIIKRYRDERLETTTEPSARFNILWSNVQTLKPAIFNRVPKPDVKRKFKDKDDVGRVASEILERALEFEVSHYDDFKDTMNHAIDDRLLPGRGVAWIRYEPEFEHVEGNEHVNDDGFQITEDADEPEGYDRLVGEHCPVDYVSWLDFGHVVARTWDEITGVWRKVYMTKEKVSERFGDEIANRLPYDVCAPSASESEYVRADDVGAKNQAAVYEYWDADTATVYWLSKSHNVILDSKADPLKLEDFFPCPRPLFATMTTDSLVPIGDYVMYQDQAKELDIICDRIGGLVKALKVAGVYDASQPAIKRLMQEAFANDLIPVNDWSMFTEKGGLQGAVQFIPITDVANALMNLYNARDQIKNVIYEVTGMGDIMRSMSDPQETATAQTLKAQFGTLRLRTAQDDVAFFATEILRIKAQIIGQHYQPETIAKISGAAQMDEDPQVIAGALQMIKNDVLRTFRIEVDADSLVEIDEQQDKADRVEFLKAAGGFLEQAMGVGAQAPELAPLLGEMLMFGIRGFKAGRQLEGEFDAAMSQLKQAAMMRMQNPQPNPEMMKSQADMQAKQAEMQANIQIQQARTQADMQIEQHKQQMEAAKQDADRQNQMALQQMEFQHKQAMRELELNANFQLQLVLQGLKNEGQVAAAEAKASSTLDQQQIDAARLAEQ